MRYILAAIFLWLLTSCGPAHKVRKAEQLLEQAGELGAKWHSDTVKTTVEVVRPEIKTVTVTKILPGDTVIQEKENVITKIIRLPGDSIIVETTVKADTVYKEVPTYITKTISAGYTQWELIGSTLGGILFTILMGLAAYKIAGLVKSPGKSG